MQEVGSDDCAEPRAGFTCRFTAGLRYVEATVVQDPLILSDPLAGVLAEERGLALAKQELAQLTKAQGPGRHLRVPARSRLIDDLLQQEIAALQAFPTASSTDTGLQAPAAGPVCQVVSLGAGMCTRPWRLAALRDCRVLELDLPDVAQTKLSLLADAGAQMAGTETVPPPAFPLLAQSYACIGLDLSACGPGALGSELRAHGFDPALPTLWVLEAVLYYMPLAAASGLLAALADLSAPRSRLIATCVDAELLEASRSGVPKGHVFADLWHFDTEDLLYGTEAFALRWEVDWRASGEEQEVEARPPPSQPAPAAAAAASPVGSLSNSADRCDGVEAEKVNDGLDRRDELQTGAAQKKRRALPPSTRSLALERLGAETYVALYGGSELLFVAGLRAPR